MKSSGSSRFKAGGRPIRSAVLALLSVGAIVAGGISMAQHPPKADPPTTSADSPKSSAFKNSDCLECHTDDQEQIKAVNAAALAKSPHKDLQCQDCHTSITDVPHTPSMEHAKPSCGDCHPDELAEFQKSSHARPDKVKGDHPTCITCHGDGDPHAIKPMTAFTRPFRVQLCSNCHGDKSRMQRYGVDPDAVSSYDTSFHGKALIEFGDTKVAVCTDCHTAHSMLPPSDPRAPTNVRNAGHLCSQKGCHGGANVNFAMSGANHLRLKMKSDPVLYGTNLFFQVLVIGMVAFLVLGVLLDLRLKVFGRGKPHSGRPAGLLVSLSFLLGTGSLAVSLFHLDSLATILISAAFGFLVLAYLTYFLIAPKAAESEPPEKMYPRFTNSQRVQHLLLFVCFTLLIATGLPLHFYTIPWLQKLYALLGGLQTAREIHRVAAVGLITVWVYHLCELFVRWAKAGFSRSALTMFPTRKDVRDFIQQTKVYLGFSKEEPEYGRFQVRQKLDYLAEYWGIPVMVISGIIMWFPIYWGDRLPQEALSMAIVAHGWEATLAFLAIILWHLYHEHFSPDAFPMRRVWITGKLSEQEMAHDHPLELKRLQDFEQGANGQ